jgi:hypothetical protein
MFVSIYDESGELVKTELVDLDISISSNENLTISKFSPSSQLEGGFVTIYLNNTAVAVWDCTNQQNNLVENGVYQIVVQLLDSTSEELWFSKNVFVSPWRGITGISFAARPNLSMNDEQISFYLTSSNKILFSNFKIEIFDVAGEVIQTLPINSSGEAVWNLDNSLQQQVSSGIYLVVLTGMNSLGLKITKVIKVGVLK